MPDTPDWDAIAAAGLLDVDASSVADRRTLIEYLLELGCTVDEMVDAHRRGRLFALGGDRILRPGARTFTFAQAAEQLGTDEDLVGRLWRALGLPASSLGEGVMSAREVEAFAPVTVLAELVGPERVVELARGIGAGLARIGEVTQAAGRTVSPESATATSSSETETAAFWVTYAPYVRAVGPVLDVFFAHHFELARDHFERSDSWDLMLRGLARLAVGFVDVSGFTTMAESLGEMDFANLIVSFTNTVSDTVAERGGRVIKFVGDAAMIVAPSAVVLAEITEELVRGETLAGQGLSLHAGLAHGELLARDGDYFGSPVNLASRLSALAESGTVMATEGVGHALAPHGWDLEWLEARDVRGLSTPIITCLVRGAGPPSR